MIGILRRAASDSINAPAASGAAAPGSRGSDRFEAAITGYVARIAGPDRAARLTRTVLAEVATEASASAAAAETLTRAARAVALGELEREARRPRTRAERLAALHWRCAATPGLLRERLESEISKAGLDSLYAHLDHCEHCAAMAARCDLAEWHLEAELAAPGQASANGAGGRRPVRPPGPGDFPSPRLVGAPAGGALAHWGRGEVEVAGGPGRGRLTGRGVGRLVAAAPRARLAAAAVVAVVILVAGVELFRGGGGHAARAGGGPGAAGAGSTAVRPGSAGAASPGATAPASPASSASPSTPATPAATTTPPATTPTRGPRAPFVVGRARYAVFSNPNQGWTGFLRTDAGPGLRWEAVTVRVRNLGTAGFDPRVLTYRVIDSRGAAQAPDPTVGTGPALGGPGHPLGPDELVETRLGFRVPVAAVALRLSFVPSPGAPAIVVGLGP